MKRGIKNDNLIKLIHRMFRVDFQNWRDEDDLGDEKEPFEEVRKLFLKGIRQKRY